MFQFPYVIALDNHAAIAVPSPSQRATKALELLETARNGEPHVRREALSAFRGLWLLIADDLCREGQVLERRAGAPSAVLATSRCVLSETEGQWFGCPAVGGALSAKDADV
jgi:flagellar biosynthesis regulator FlaF